MAALDGLPPLRDVIQRHGLDAKKSLGQNFLLDLNLTQKVARTAGPLEDCTVIEVGPGPGGLTRALLEAGARVIAVEKDARFAPLLAELADAAEGRLSVEKIVNTGLCAAQALRRDFGIDKPRLAVAGLNPHAGESGSIGREDVEIVAPAVEALKAEGVDVRGPAPADTLFHAEARATYDCALCLYHDQALIPVKMLDFWGGVNVTLGLPIVRTSPDHGTAFDIAGRGIARPDSLIAAIRLAAEIATRRP